MPRVSKQEILEFSFTKKELRYGYDIFAFSAKPAILHESEFKKITLKIPKNYLREDQEAKIRAVLLAIINYHLILQRHTFEESKFTTAVWNPLEGSNNLSSTEAFDEYLKHIASFSAALQLMQDVVISNGITYQCIY